MQNERIKYLFIRHMDGTSTTAEEEELALLVLKMDDTAIAELMKESWNAWEGSRGMEPARAEALLQSILPAEADTRRSRSLYRLPWLRYAAAGIILLVAGCWWLLRRPAPATTPVITTAVQQGDAPPGGNKALLTLADGSTIVLDSAADGQLGNQGGTKILKLNASMLTYHSAGRLPAAGPVLYNTISTPRGGQYQVVLPDGTHVWLNAASSIRFPTMFAGKERSVQVEGEVYFEVAASREQPFLVNFRNMKVQVLGTRFNINAYSNEAYIQTTLLDGSIKVTREANTRLLKPGEQAQVANSGSDEDKIIVKPNADIEKTMAWKNGLFNFEGATLKEVTNQLERWYNIEVVYEGKVPVARFFGKVSRNIMLSDLLKGLEDPDLHFRMEGGHRLVVLP